MITDVMDILQSQNKDGDQTEPASPEKEENKDVGDEEMVTYVETIEKVPEKRQRNYVTLVK